MRQKIVISVVGFGFGLFVGLYVNFVRTDLFDPYPWQVRGENRGQAEERIQRKANQLLAKPPFLSYRLIRCKHHVNSEFVECDCNDN